MSRTLTVLTASRKKPQNILKLNFLQMLDKIAIKIFSSDI